LHRSLKAPAGGADVAEPGGGAAEEEGVSAVRFWECLEGAESEFSAFVAQKSCRATGVLVDLDELVRRTVVSLLVRSASVLDGIVGRGGVVHESSSSSLLRSSTVVLVVVASGLVINDAVAVDLVGFRRGQALGLFLVRAGLRESLIGREVENLSFLLVLAAHGTQQAFHELLVHVLLGRAHTPHADDVEGLGLVVLRDVKDREHVLVRLADLGLAMTAQGLPQANVFAGVAVSNALLEKGGLGRSDFGRVAHS